MPNFLQRLDARLGLLPILKELRSALPKERIPLSEAPPFSLGRLNLILLGFLVASGLALTLFYVPTAERAASSLADLHLRQPLGWLIHNTHRWSALLFFVTVILHVLRVWIGQAYLFPRDVNWWAGLGLLLLTVVLGGTGYILRWDIKAFALMDLVITNFARIPIIGRPIIAIMLGGTELNAIPLQRGYALHVWFLPLVLILVLGLHLIIAWWQGLAERSTFWETLQDRLPNKRWVDFLPGVFLLILVIGVSAMTPHEGRSGPTELSPWPHPDWLLMFYYLPFWLFQSEARIFGALIIPLALLVFLVLTPRLFGNRLAGVTRFALASLGIAGVFFLLAQMRGMGSQVPLQGCTACHREGILGGAPTELTEFKIHDPDWLVFHLEQPEKSILEPYEGPQEIP